MMMKLKDKVYDYLVRRNKNVQYEYERYVMEHTLEHYENRTKHWKILWKLIKHYRINKSKEPLLYFDTGNKNISVERDLTKQKIAVEKKNQPVVRKEKTDLEKFLSGPESEISNRPKPFQFAIGLQKYDVVSFDIFDTLLLRPFASPVDLFDIVGKRLNYPEIFIGYKKARREAEREARDELEKKLGTREINIYEIYEQLEKKIGIDREEGIKTELQVEEDYLYANPYMKIVFNILKSQGKTIILTSDMYIPGEKMEKLLEKCGYTGYEKLYVSCDYRCNKLSGELYRRVRADFPDKKIIHIGDNFKSDIQSAKNVGFDVSYYKNVNEIGQQFRGQWMSALTGSAYSGLINAYIHNGLNQFPFFYEYGFIYGGLYVFGFCNWIEKRAKEEGIDKLIFLSRDGDIYQKVYNEYFGKVSNDYIFWSRFANLKYMVKYNQDAFFERVIKQKVFGTLDVELSSILGMFHLPITEEELKKYGLFHNSLVSRYNMEAIKHCISDHWDKILHAYDEEKELVKEEVRTIIGDARRIAVIDVGWTASGPMGFKHFVEQNISADLDVRCWMAGGAGQYGTASSILPDYLDDTVEAYLFSPMHNKRNEQIHVTENVAVTNNAVFELFTQTQYPSFRGRTGQGAYEFDIPETENYQVIAQVHKGILDFCNLYHNIFSKDIYLYNISGWDAYRPFTNLAFHKRYFENNFCDIVNGYGLSGDNNKQHIETIGERMKNYYKNNGGKK